MAIKANTQVITPAPAPKYPCLRMWDQPGSPAHGQVVLFTSIETGVALTPHPTQDDGSEPAVVGEVSDDWIDADDSHWVPCEITLKAED